MSVRGFVSASAFVVTLAFAFSTRAGEIQLDVGAAVRKSTWRGDWTGGTQLGGGYRFARLIAIDFVVWEELATVDKRLNTGLTVGVTAALPLEKFRPTLRVYFIHQHEEGLVSVYENPFGTVAGIGAGIRHRAGVGARLGLEIPFSKKGKHVEWVALTGIDATWFPDNSLGASLFVGAMGGLGLNYSLEELP